MRKLTILIALVLPILSFAQTGYAITTTPRYMTPEEAAFFVGTTITKVIDGGPGVGKFNLMIYTPPGVTSDTIGEIFINGSGEAGTDVNKGYVNGPFYWQKNGWAPPYVIAFAQTPLNYPPNRGDKPYFMIAALKELLNGGYHIDKKRFFLTGLSYGAAYIFEYMQYAAAADYIQPAGIIPMSMAIYGTVGDYNKGTDALAGNDLRFKTVPMWGFCGTADNFYVPMKHTFDMMAKAGYPVTFTGYSEPKPHSVWNTQYDPNLKPIPTPFWIMLKAADAVTTPPVIIATNKPPVPVINTLQTITAPTAWITLDGSASYDPDGTIDSVAYTQISGPSSATIISTTCDTKAAAVGLVPGSYIFKLQLFDNQRASAQVLVSVVVNPAPVTTVATVPLSFTILGAVISKTLTVKSDGTYTIQ